MVRFLVAFGFLASSSTVFAEQSAPWFGSEASPPQQVVVKVSEFIQANSGRDQDCTISGCSTLVKAAKPEQKSASNP
jgi:hypothetical protein